MRVDLRSGQWAELRDPLSLTAGQRRPLGTVMGHGKRVETGVIDEATGKPQKSWDYDTIVELGDAACLVFIESWSYDFPSPDQNPDWVKQIPAIDYDELVEACVPLIDRAFLDTSEKGTDPT